MSTGRTTLAPRVQQLMEVLRPNLRRLRQEFGVRDLRLFGSHARGEESADSDVDILVSFDVTPSLFQFVDLETELADLLGTRVDLVMKDALKPAIGKRILAEAIPV